MERNGFDCKYAPIKNPYLIFSLVVWEAGGALQYTYAHYRSWSEYYFLPLFDLKEAALFSHTVY